ncbi:NAD-dependent epimerase/dehydratase family protein [Paraburkholderia sp. GAS334]|uniref:NAD-dependent epimerase/dehydratase family protein n=1 Tax=Paraburkholderia sp. GAS334 TaxID=3035131 RepID=UPI003D213CC5
MKVFVTGGCGQIGSHVTEMLLERGDEVLAIDNLATGRREHLKDHPNLTVVIDTIADKALVDKLTVEFKPDAIVHTAASYKDPEDWYNDTLTNCVGGSNLISAAKANKIGRFIYFQTALCYGVKPLQQPIRLDHPKLPANSSYAISKTVAEDYLEISGIDYVSFRLANVIGPRNVSGPLPIFFDRLTQGKRCFVTKARRDFVFVKDLARNVLKAIDGVGQGAYHFSSGTDVAIQELYDAVVNAMVLPDYPQPDVRELGPDDAPSILLDPSRTFADFGAIEFTPLSQTAAEAVAYYREFGIHGGYTHLKHSETK